VDRGQAAALVEFLEVMGQIRFLPQLHRQAAVVVLLMLPWAVPVVQAVAAAAAAVQKPAVLELLIKAEQAVAALAMTQPTDHLAAAAVHPLPESMEVQQMAVPWVEMVSHHQSPDLA
jgi:hypothetical protein